MTRVIQAPTATIERWKDDFEGFAAHLHVIDERGTRQGLRPRWIQSAFEIERSGHDIVLKPRQVGLTTWELARDIWYFLTKEGVRVVIVCQSSQDDAATKEISEKLSVMFEGLADAGIDIPLVTNGETPTKWILKDRRSSLRIVGAGASEKAAKKKGRSGTIHRLHVTELAFFEYGQATMNAILECVPGKEYGSEIVIESTANGAAGPYYEAYQRAKEGKGALKAHFFSWLQEPKYSAALEPGEVIEPQTTRETALFRMGASPEQVKWYRRKVEDKGQELTDQEYPLDEKTCFLSAGRTYFDKDRTRSLIDLANSTPPIRVREIGGDGGRGKVSYWAEPKPTTRYLVVGDPSEGAGGDPCAVGVFDRMTGEHVAKVHGQFGNIEFARVLAEIADEFGQGPEDRRDSALVALERNNHGHAVHVALKLSHPRTKLWVAEDEKPGWNNTSVSRNYVLEALYDVHKDGSWSTPDTQTLGEFLTFIIGKKGKAEASYGAHDDLVIVQAIAHFVLTRARWKPPSGNKKPPPADGSRWGEQRGF